MTDQELLHDYAQHGSEAAFTELVRRHVDLVYSTAVRIACDGTSAEDITQNVFIALAKSAKHLTSRPVLAGWLHQTTRNIAANTIRSHAMMVTFGYTDDLIVAGRTSEAYLVAPYGENKDLEMSVALVEKKRFWWWREFYEGLAQYRLGNSSAAADFLEKDISKLPSVNQIDRPPCEADLYLVLAMARRQLNQPAEAAAALAHGRQVVETQMPQPGAPDLGPYWWNGVTTRALLKEASETVEQWTPNPANASLTFSLARSATNAAPSAKAVIPLSGPYSEPPAGPLHIVPESVTVNNGQMQFTIAGITSGATVCVLGSGELFTPASWVLISTNIATTTTLTVGVPATNAHQFFRILETR